jgi:hypothetical protein
MTNSEIMWKMTPVVLAVWLLTSPTFAQTKHAAVVQKPQGQKLSPTFLKPAGRALDAARSDLVSKANAFGKPTAVTDRIDEAQAVATTDGDKAFVEALRSFYDNRIFANIMTFARQVNIELDLQHEMLTGRGVFLLERRHA